MQGDISSNNRRRNRREGIIPRMRILNQNLMKSATIRLHFSENSFSVSPTKAKNFGCHSQPARPYFDEHVMWQVRQQSVDEPPQHRSLPIAAKPLLFPFFFSPATWAQNAIRDGVASPALSGEFCVSFFPADAHLGLLLVSLSEPTLYFIRVPCRQNRLAGFKWVNR